MTRRSRPSCAWRPRNGVGRVLVGQGGLLSTPAASNLIRERKAAGGIILSASHNPGGPDGDFGIKFNTANGGPAPEKVTDAIYARTQSLDRAEDHGHARHRSRAAGRDPAGRHAGRDRRPGGRLCALMERLFDFEAIRALFRSGFRMRFDAMSAITGPYAHHIIEGMLGAPAGTVVNGTPLPDFGGHHPDPNLGPLRRSRGADERPGRAGPGCRLRRRRRPQPDPRPGPVRGPLRQPGPARGQRAAGARLRRRAQGRRALDADLGRASTGSPAKLGIPCFETPTGWKFFGNLLDAGKASLCGEESAGTGSDHVREKDGLWAVLLWLNILAKRRQGVAEIVRAHWAEFGRNYYSRHDYEAIDAKKARGAGGRRCARSWPGLPGTTASAPRRSPPPTISPTPTRSTARSAEHQGIRLHFASGARIVYRLSGTGTEGATLRVYLERFEPERLDEDTQAFLAPLIAIADEVAGIRQRTGRADPDVDHLSEAALTRHQGARALQVDLGRREQCPAARCAACRAHRRRDAGRALSRRRPGGFCSASTSIASST